MIGKPGEGKSVPLEPEMCPNGTMVRHPIYGLGRIVAIEGSGPTTKVTVDFGASVAPVKFVLQKSPLRPAQSDQPEKSGIKPCCSNSVVGEQIQPTEAQMTFQEVVEALKRERPGIPLGDTAKAGAYYERAVRLTNFERYWGTTFAMGQCNQMGG